MIKIITGIRRCGKSYLLDPIYKDYLLSTGVKENHIIKLALDREENRKYHDASELNKYIKALVGQNISFSRFVILACEYALLNMETSNDIDKQKRIKISSLHILILFTFLVLKYYLYSRSQ